MHTCIHAYMHTCIHAYMHTCIHTYIHTYIHTSASRARPHVALARETAPWLKYNCSIRVSSITSTTGTCNFNPPFFIPPFHYPKERIFSVALKYVCVYMIIRVMRDILRVCSMRVRYIDISPTMAPWLKSHSTYNNDVYVCICVYIYI